MNKNFLYEVTKNEVTKKINKKGETFLLEVYRSYEKTIQEISWSIDYKEGSTYGQITFFTILLGFDLRVEKYWDRYILADSVFMHIDNDEGTVRLIISGKYDNVVKYFKDNHLKIDRNSINFRRKVFKNMLEECEKIIKDFE